MRLSTGHGFDAAAARQVAQLIGPYVNDANTGIPPGGVLIGNQTFERLVLEKAPVLLSDTNDPATRAALARLAQQQNVSASALLTPAQLAALGLGGGFAGGGRSSSASYDFISSAGANGDWNTPAGQDYMRQYAIEQGLSWATNIPDLLRLGPSAIRALADVHLTQETYQRLKDNVAFSAKDTVAFARFSKEKKIDANAAGDAISDVGEGLNPGEKKKLHDGVMPYIRKPDDKKAQEGANDAFERVRKDHPEKGDAIDRAKEKVKLRVEQTHKAETRAETHEARTENKVTAKDAGLGELNSELASAAPSPSSPTNPPKPHDRKPNLQQRAELSSKQAVPKPSIG